MLNKRNIFILIGLIVVIWIGSIAICKILVPDKNPPRRYTGIILGSDADKILSRVCFNCHSNETKWPWYTSLPVISVLIYSDVGEARTRLNFSDWGSLPADKRMFYLELALNEIERGEMPPLIYKLGHPEAKINAHDLEILKKQANAVGISFNPGAKFD